MSPEQLVRSLYASVNWRLQRRWRLCVANVVVNRFGTAPGVSEPKNPGIVVRFLPLEEVLVFSGDHALGLDAADVSARFDQGEIFIASLDGDVLAGYDWYRPTPVCLEQGAVYFRFDESLICSTYSFVQPCYRGRSLSADRWDFAHREFSARGWQGTVYYIETHNFPSLRAAARRRTAHWVGHFVYIRVIGYYIRWTSRGCRRVGVRLTSGSQARPAS